uniref:hypothetical protein n=1 Tax=Nitrospira cf. moscoviensis SBR1015 TaxID=96242 RepID=UPI00111E8BDB|nr:hypothetical protein [Nitrospira cf. moscoviensis SBR1015]
MKDATDYYQFRPGRSSLSGRSGLSGLSGRSARSGRSGFSARSILSALSDRFPLSLRSRTSRSPPLTGLADSTVTAFFVSARISFRVCRTSFITGPSLNPRDCAMAPHPIFCVRRSPTFCNASVIVGYVSGSAFVSSCAKPRRMVISPQPCFETRRFSTTCGST